MNAKTRILTIRLLDKIRRYPDFAEKLGIGKGEEKWDLALDLDCLK